MRRSPTLVNKPYLGANVRVCEQWFYEYVIRQLYKNSPDDGQCRETVTVHVKWVGEKCLCPHLWVLCDETNSNWIFLSDLSNTRVLIIIRIGGDGRSISEGTVHVSIVARYASLSGLSRHRSAPHRLWVRRVLFRLDTHIVWGKTMRQKAFLGLAVFTTKNICICIVL